MRFKEYSINNRLNEQVNLFGGGNDEAMQVLADGETSNLIKKAYRKTHKYVRKGFLWSFFYFISLYTLSSAIFPLMIDI